MSFFFGQVSDDEDIQHAHTAGMRPVSVTVFHCVHQVCAE
jgi:hypothetical protein